MQIDNIPVAEISVEEYDYLTEFIDFYSGDKAVGTKFLIYNRQDKLKKLVKKVIENELTENERAIVTDFWCNEIPAEKLIGKYNISRSMFYRIVRNARKKIENSLKYVLLYDEIIIPKSTEEILGYARKSEN